MSKNKANKQQRELLRLKKENNVLKKQIRSQVPLVSSQKARQASASHVKIQDARELVMPSGHKLCTPAMNACFDIMIDPFNSNAVPVVSQMTYDSGRSFATRGAFPLRAIKSQSTFTENVQPITVDTGEIGFAYFGRPTLQMGSLSNAYRANNSTAFDGNLFDVSIAGETNWTNTSLVMDGFVPTTLPPTDTNWTTEELVVGVGLTITVKINRAPNADQNGVFYFGRTRYNYVGSDDVINLDAAVKRGICQITSATTVQDSYTFFVQPDFLWREIRTGMVVETVNQMATAQHEPIWFLAYHGDAQDSDFEVSFEYCGLAASDRTNSGIKVIVDETAVSCAQNCFRNYFNRRSTVAYDRGEDPQGRKSKAHTKRGLRRLATHETARGLPGLLLDGAISKAPALLKEIAKDSVEFEL